MLKYVVLVMSFYNFEGGEQQYRFELFTDKSDCVEASEKVATETGIISNILNAHGFQTEWIRLECRYETAA